MRAPRIRPLGSDPGTTLSAVPDRVDASAGSSVAPLADLCDRDPLDLDSDPRLCPGGARAVATPCGALCTPWCLTSHSGVPTLDR